MDNGLHMHSVARVGG